MESSQYIPPPYLLAVFPDTMHSVIAGKDLLMQLIPLPLP